MSMSFFPNVALPSTMSVATTKNVTVALGVAAICTKRISEVGAEAGAELTCSLTISGFSGTAGVDVRMVLSGGGASKVIDGEDIVIVDGVVSRTVTEKLPLTPLSELSSA